MNRNIVFLITHTHTVKKIPISKSHTYTHTHTHTPVIVFVPWQSIEERNVGTVASLPGWGWNCSLRNESKQNLGRPCPQVHYLENSAPDPLEGCWASSKCHRQPVQKPGQGGFFFLTWLFQLHFRYSCARTPPPPHRQGLFTHLVQNKSSFQGILRTLNQHLGL